MTNKIEDEWISVKDRVPTENGMYSVIKKVQKSPTYAIYHIKTKEWMITINNNYWMIKGVEYWQELPAKLTRK